MLSPDTSSGGDSIWNLVKRARFEKNVAGLLRENNLPGSSQIYNLRDWLSEDGHSSTTMLPLDIERELVDDFAFIAACEEGVKTVTAATVEVSGDVSKVVLAANEGIQSRVEIALKDLLQRLEDCAQRKLSREACTSQALDIVLQLNRNRIYGRLGCRKYLPPKHRSWTTSQPLTDELRQIVTKVQPIRPYDRTARKGLLREIEDLHEAFHKMDDLSEFHDTDAIKVLLDQAYRMTVDGVSLTSRLKSSGFPGRCLNCKQVQQLMKLANYSRVCYSLAKKARSFREQFASLKLQVLIPYEPSFWHGQKRFVHAEIQIISHYEINQVDPRPRVMGASKEACFLCDSFIRAHGRFFLSKAHRQLFDQWTVPDLEQYDSLARKRLQEALVHVNQDITVARAEKEGIRSRRPYPHQSSVNLSRAVVREASMSTIKSFNPSKTSGFSLGPASATAPKQPPKPLLINAPTFTTRSIADATMRSEFTTNRGTSPTTSSSAEKEATTFQTAANAVTASPTDYKDSFESVTERSYNKREPSISPSRYHSRESDAIAVSDFADESVVVSNSANLAVQSPHKGPVPMKLMHVASWKGRHPKKILPYTSTKPQRRRTHRRLPCNSAELPRDRIRRRHRRKRTKKLEDQIARTHMKRGTRVKHRSSKRKSSSAHNRRGREKYEQTRSFRPKEARNDGGCLISLCKGLTHAFRRLFSLEN